MPVSFEGYDKKGEEIEIMHGGDCLKLGSFCTCTYQCIQVILTNEIYIQYFFRIYMAYLTLFL